MKQHFLFYDVLSGSRSACACGTSNVSLAVKHHCARTTRRQVLWWNSEACRQPSEPATQQIHGTNEILWKMSGWRKNCLAVCHRARATLCMVRIWWWYIWWKSLRAISSRTQQLWSSLCTVHGALLSRKLCRKPLQEMMETVTEATIKCQSKTVHTVPRAKGCGKDQEGSKRPLAQKACYSCGNSTYGLKVCPYIKAKCHRCERLGRTKKMCRKAESSGQIQTMLNWRSKFLWFVIVDGLWGTNHFEEAVASVPDGWSGLPRAAG